jgi:hypothetical protein
MYRDRLPESAVRFPIPAEMEESSPDLGGGDVTHLRFANGIERGENLDDLAVTMLEASLTGALERRFEFACERELAWQENDQDDRRCEVSHHGQTVSRRLLGVHDAPHVEGLVCAQV